MFLPGIFIIIFLLVGLKMVYRTYFEGKKLPRDFPYIYIEIMLASTIWFNIVYPSTIFSLGLIGIFVFSFIGEIFIAKSSKPVSFIIGIVLYIISHSILIITLLLYGNGFNYLVLIISSVLILLYFFVFIFPGVKKNIFIAIGGFIYICINILSISAATNISSADFNNVQLISIPIAVFSMAFSDAIIGWKLFVKPFKTAEIFITSFYFISQTAYVISLVSVLSCIY